MQFGNASRCKGLFDFHPPPPLKKKQGFRLYGLQGFLSISFFAVFAYTPYNHFRFMDAFFSASLHHHNKTIEYLID